MLSVVDSPGREEDAVPKKAGSEPLRSNALQPPNKSSMRSATGFYERHPEIDLEQRLRCIVFLISM